MTGSVWFLVGCASANPDDMVMHMGDYDHSNFWYAEPTVVLCRGQSQFDVEDVRYVLQLWERPYKKIVERKRCNYDLERGYIKITDGKFLKSDEWGYTSYYYYDVLRNGMPARKYTAALVQIDNRIQHRAILVHEMGHAFGYHHVDIENDVMNTYADYSRYYR